MRSSRVFIDIPDENGMDAVWTGLRERAPAHGDAPHLLRWQESRASHGNILHFAVGTIGWVIANRSSALFVPKGRWNGSPPRKWRVTIRTTCSKSRRDGRSQARPEVPNCRSVGTLCSGVMCRSSLRDFGSVGRPLPPLAWRATDPVLPPGADRESDCRAVHNGGCSTMSRSSW